MVRIQKSPKGYTLKLVPTGGLSAIRAIYHSQPSQRRPRSSCLDVPGSGPSCARAHAQQKTLPMLARLHVGRGGELTLQDLKKRRKEPSQNAATFLGFIGCFPRCPERAARTGAPCQPAHERPACRSTRNSAEERSSGRSAIRTQIYSDPETLPPGRKETTQKPRGTPRNTQETRLK